MHTVKLSLGLTVAFLSTMVIGFWSLVTPIFEFPDEQAHFSSVEFMFHEGRMPQYEERDMTIEMYDTQRFLGVFRNNLGQNAYTYHPEHRLTYTPSFVGQDEAAIIASNTPDFRSVYVATEAARYPRSYYDYGSFWEKIVSTKDIFTRLFVIRLGGLGLTLLMAYTVWQTGMLVFHRSRYATTLTLMVMLEPMMSFLSAGINSDNLHNLLCFVVIYACLRLIHSGPDLKGVVLLALAPILDILTKPQGFITLPIIAVAVLLFVIKKRYWRLLIWTGLAFFVVLFLTRGQTQMYRGFIYADNTRGLSFFDYLHFSLGKLLAQNVVWYWGVFKWLGVVLPPLYWRVANRFVLISGLGLGVYIWKIWRKKKTFVDPYAIFFVLCSIFIYSLAIYWFDWQYSKAIGYSIGIQARYFFPTLPGQMILIFTGLLSLAWNNQVRRWFRLLLVFLFAWLQLGGIWRLITSYYDVSSFTAFMTQVSQYKPYFAKGDWWYLWVGLYLVALILLLKLAWGKSRK